MAAAVSLVLAAACQSTAHARVALPVSQTRLLVYHDVSVNVPASWPVIDGDHVNICTGSFPAPPVAYVGAQRNGLPPCAPPSTPSGPVIDGVWLQPGEPSGDVRPVTLPSGQTIEESRTPGLLGGTVVWSHGVQIELAGHADAGVSRAMLDSIDYQAGRSDTPAAQMCSATADVMPAPERVTQDLVIHSGQTTLAPPHAGDQPRVSAAEAWAHAEARSPLDSYRLLLTRYSSAYPAQVGPNGATRPQYQDLLAWVVYSTSATPAFDGCGERGVGVDVIDATTGQDLGFWGE
jgi:hypothetical protein